MASYGGLSINETTTVIGSNVRVRNSPVNGSTLYSAQLGVNVKVLDKEAGSDGYYWYQIDNLDDSTRPNGWIRGDFLDGADGSGDSGDSGNSGTATTGIITGDSVRVRSAPNTTSTILAHVNTGDLVTYYAGETYSGSGYTWYRCTGSQWTGDGYISTTYVAPYTSGGTGDSGNIPTTGLFYAKVDPSNGGTLKIRSTPSTANGHIGEQPNGRILLCEESGTSGWYKIRFRHNDAYVMASHMTLLSQSVHNNYVDRMLFISAPEIGRNNEYYFDNASDPWCQLFVNWILNAAHLPSVRVPSTSNTGEGIQFWVNNATFHFKNAEWKGKLNTRYSLGVGSTLTNADVNYTPAVGDVIYFRWDGAENDVYVSHTGIVTNVSGSRVYTIEGNGAGNAVVEKDYALTDSEIVGYGTPNYT